MNEDQEAFLTDSQARVLGCLMEKQMTTPDYYPLTLKALQAACNQKSSRVPIMELSLGQVGSIVNELRAEGLVTARMDGRADRFEQHLSRKFKFTTKERALICVLMLRGRKLSMRCAFTPGAWWISTALRMFWTPLIYFRIKMSHWP